MLGAGMGAERGALETGRQEPIIGLRGGGLHVFEQITGELENLGAGLVVVGQELRGLQGMAGDRVAGGAVGAVRAREVGGDPGVHAGLLIRAGRGEQRLGFVPDRPEKLDEDCYEAFNIQVDALMRRIESTGAKSLVIGISGGLDSTHALIIAAKACDRLGLPRDFIRGYTMPGFGTSDGTKSNAHKLMAAMGITALYGRTLVRARCWFRKPIAARMIRRWIHLT